MNAAFVCRKLIGWVQIGIKGGETVLDAALHKRVDTDECYWTMSTEDGGKVIEIILVKSNKMEWWDAIAEVNA